MRRYLLTIALPLLLSPIVHAADDDALLAQLLTCNPSADHRIRTTMMKSLKARSTPDGDGRAKISGRIQVGKLCIDKAQLTGAFGVLMASGSVCDGEPASLTDFLKQTRSDLKPADATPPPQVLAAFEAPKYSMVLYRGEPGFDFALPDPASKHLSYRCSFQESGPQ
jgi:hypothetical protein